MDNGTPLYNESDIPEWKERIKWKKRFDLTVFSAVVVAMSIGLILLIVGMLFIDKLSILCGAPLFILGLFTSILGWRAYSDRGFLKIYPDKLFFPIKMGKNKEYIKISDIKELYPNNNHPYPYITIVLKQKNEIWKNDVVTIMKEDVYSPQKMIETLKSLGVNVVEDEDKWIGV